MKKDQKGSTKNDFRDLLTSEDLWDSDSWEDMAKRIKSSKRHWDWTNLTLTYPPLK
jgi:hypothetical protein